MHGKTYEEVREIQERFMAQYFDGSTAMSGVGVGKDNGDYCLYVNFEITDGLDTIPAEFEGVKVITRVIGVVRAGQKQSTEES